MKLYAVCPICAHKLCKGEVGTEIDIRCPRCGRLIKAVITKTEVKVVAIEEKKE